ncbi:MAG: small subunit ribosomal protein [Candidatus Parcubacteria bacterium]|nr:small subunit ribosomal protein [Candidatus Parcubacteria bacterium]
MDTKKTIGTMFNAGAHFGLGRSRRHPTVSPYIFGTKNNTDIFDLEKTENLLEKAKEFVTTLANEGKIILFVGGKKEASTAVKNAALSLNMPYVDGRWIGGTITNFGQMRKRIDRYEKLVSDREKGELAKYTKRERMLIDKEVASLEKMFLGIVSLKKGPDALFVVDPRHEKGAVKEAADFNIPIIALAGSDCNIAEVTYPIVGNDGSKGSIQFFVDEIAKTYQAGKSAGKSESGM